MLSIEDIKNRLNENKNYINTKKAELAILNKEKEEKIAKKENLETRNNTLLTIKKLIEDASDEARENGRQLLSSIATSSVQSVFGDNTEVALEQTMKDGIPNINVVVKKKIKDGIVNIDPDNSDGGGLADIVDLAFFMTFGQMVNDNYAPYILDEPTKWVSKGELAEKSAQFLKNIVVLTNKQTIISTHDTEIQKEKCTKYRMVLDKDTGITTAYKEG